MVVKEYLKKIYKTRYFWSYLVKSDLKSRFRRSKLGLLWMFLQPLLLTLIMSFVFSTVFKQPLGEYAIYILSGIVVWNLISSSTVSGGSCIIAGEQYIRQYNHPITIYSLRSSLTFLITFLLEMSALLIWIMLTNPLNLIFGFITLPLTTLLYFGLTWPLTTMAGYINTKYRDYPQMMALIMQTIWYLSPVFFKEEMFQSNPILKRFFMINPITHVLSLIREPFIYGRMPSAKSYLIVVLAICIFTICAYAVNKKNEKKIIFYL